MKTFGRRILLVLVVLGLGLGLNTGKAFAWCGDCCSAVAGCSASCSAVSADQTSQTITHINTEFINHREWMVKVMFEQHVLPALMLFAEQMTAMAMHQVMIIGTFLDAKHQLETQRLFQQLMAEAHKDYQPSEGMCTFGTAMRSLAASDRNTDLVAGMLSQRGLQRELLSGDALAANGQTSDYLSRIDQFRKVYCNLSDNGGKLNELCPSPSTDLGRTDNDISYTNLIDSPLTLKLDPTDEGDPDHNDNAHLQTVSADEEDLLALGANLYANKVAPTIAATYLSDKNGAPIDEGVQNYQNIRAIAAKRSVARNSFVSIAAMKAQGEKEVQPYLYAIMKEMGISDEDEIQKYLGDRPSYYAQMEILTKKLYQNPIFYTELYDKPANIDRKTVAMQAIELMQRRDMYRSVLRSEATLSVMLETSLLDKDEDRIVNEINRLAEDGEFAKMP
jgi:hypothetical protein